MVVETTNFADFAEIFGLFFVWRLLVVLQTALRISGFVVFLLFCPFLSLRCHNNVDSMQSPSCTFVRP